MSPLQFHLALNVSDIKKTAHFYRNVLGLECKEILVNGKQRQLYVDFFGHNLAFDEKHKYLKVAKHYSKQEIASMLQNRVVPDMHFGTVGLSYNEFSNLTKRIEDKHVPYLIMPTICDRGKSCEQLFAFIQDPEGYIIELRALKQTYTLNQIENWVQQDKGKTVSEV